jgi:hypothetical protein
MAPGDPNRDAYPVRVEWIVFAGVGVVLVVFAVVAQRLGWIDLTSRNARSRGGTAFGVVDEVFFPTKHEVQVQQDRESIMPAPAPVPGDGDKDIYNGNVRIDLTRPR